MQRIAAFSTALAALLLAGCSTAPSVRYGDALFDAQPLVTEEGIASFYHANWLGVGERMANGKRLHQWDMTAAHRTLPFGTLVTITNLSTGATATCTVEDRGPYVDGLVIDLAKDVFTKLASLSTGTIQVRISW